MTKEKTIKINGATEKHTYEEVCNLLGMNHEIRFVEITNRGTISFTAGKQHEIRLLLNRVNAAGMVPAKALKHAAE